MPDAMHDLFQAEFDFFHMTMPRKLLPAAVLVFLAAAQGTVVATDLRAGAHGLRFRLGSAAFAASLTTSLAFLPSTRGWAAVHVL